jgi:hypothetical protein
MTTPSPAPAQAAVPPAAATTQRTWPGGRHIPARRSLQTAVSCRRHVKTDPCAASEF